ncbi:MAG: hypothetical protein A2Y16_04430 [Tenericutes bacterium GWF2_57_13]|nr:MAG: hypothetical protein A2Y16_04430 [Tenericutes bacterium GWF2_57_13]
MLFSVALNRNVRSVKKGMKNIHKIVMVKTNATMINAKWVRSRVFIQLIPCIIQRNNMNEKKNTII